MVYLRLAVSFTLVTVGCIALGAGRGSALFLGSASVAGFIHPRPPRSPLTFRKAAALLLFIAIIIVLGYFFQLLLYDPVFDPVFAASAWVVLLLILVRDARRHTAFLQRKATTEDSDEPQLGS